MLRVAYLARNDATDIRVSKECNALAEAGHRVAFVGWDRTPGRERPDSTPGVEKLLYGRPAEFGAAAAALGGGGYLAHAARHLRALRPDVVHCVNEDLAAFALALRPVLGYRVVCDLFDSIALRWSAAPLPAAAAARMTARLAHVRSDALLVTDEERRLRLGKPGERAFVVPNYPIDPGPELALRFPPREGPLRLYVCGSLTALRGLDVITELLRRRDDVLIVCAGWVRDAAAGAFVEHPAVEYHGTLSPDASLELAGSCHAIVALYPPANENNLLASPNKVYDALCVGRPLLINREARISRWIEEIEAGYLHSYGDVEALCGVVDTLARERGQMRERAERLRRLFETGYSWSVAEQALLAAYECLG